MNASDSDTFMFTSDWPSSSAQGAGETMIFTNTPVSNTNELTPQNIVYIFTDEPICKLFGN